MHTEAKSLYKTAYRQFWSQTQFELIRPDNKEPLKWSVKNLCDEDLKHITKLTLIRGHKNAAAEDTVYELLDTRGGWCKNDRRGKDLFQVTVHETMFGQTKLDWKNWGTRERMLAGLDRAARHATMKEQLTLLLNLDDRDPAKEADQLKDLVKAAGLYGEEAWADEEAAEARLSQLMMAMAMANSGRRQS